MKLRLFATITVVFFLCSMAAAQSYHIRVTHSSNLRATHSLEGDIIETAPAGATLHVVGKVNRWLKIDRNGNEVWMADWIDYTRVENSAQPAAQTGATATTTAIDNCCFVDRQCQSDQDWTDGYWAFQNGQCPAPAQSQSGITPPPASNAAGPIDNCCFAGWHCQSELEWAKGYYAYRDNQCDAPLGSTTPEIHADSCCQLGWNCTFDFDFIMGKWVYADNDGWCNSPRQEHVDGMIIEGSEAFINQHIQAMNLIKSRAPEWYAYTIDIIRKIRESNDKTGYGTLHKSFNMPVWDTVDYAAAIIIHETCHVHRSFAGVHTTEIENIAEEAICDQVAINSLNQISPGTPYPRSRIDEFLSLGLNYDIGPSVQREWDRARRIYARTN